MLERWVYFNKQEKWEILTVKSEQLEEKEDETVLYCARSHIAQNIYKPPKTSLFLDPQQIQGGSQYMHESNSGVSGIIS